MGRWKLILLRSAGFGAGFAVTIAVIIGMAFWYFNRPKPEPKWNENALKATFNELTMWTTTENVVLRYSYVVENTTTQDYAISELSDVIVMTVLPEHKGLDTDAKLALTRPIYIPAKQKVAIELTRPYDYDKSYPNIKRGDTEKLEAFVTRRIKEREGFMVLDRTMRYMMTLPPKWPLRESGSKATLMPQ